MKETPILFSTPMVQAIIEKRKTMTRRSIKNLAIDENSGITFFNNKGMYDIHRWKEEILKDCPFGKVGDILWVRETYSIATHSNRKSDYVYRAGMNPDQNRYVWKPSLFMPKVACRIILRIKDIRVELLEDISEEDCIKEGVEEIHPAPFLIRFNNYLGGSFFTTAKESFVSLWNSINGKGSFSENQYVWVIEFESAIAE